MALNWEKLTKLQRDYPKPKFAFAEALRQLKKKPNDPYLWAWRADLLLRLNDTIDASFDQWLQPLYGRQPPLTDSHLLSYIYKIQLETTKRQNFFQRLHLSAGTKVRDSWLDAAKALPSRKARLELWSDLFVTALQGDCWDDVALALNSASKDNQQAKKRIRFTMILANQLIFEKNQEVAGEQGLDFKAKTLGQLALRMIQAAFEATGKTPEDPIRMEDMRDLRFMAQIFSRQGAHEKLFEIWEKPPPALQNLMQNFADDFYLMKMEILKKNEVWRTLHEYSIAAFEKVMEEVNRSGSDEPLNHLLVNNWQLFGSMLEVKGQLNISEEMADKRENLIPGSIESYFTRPADETTRSYDVSHMALVAATAFTNQALLPLCESYWLKNRNLTACYKDLRPFIESLDSQGRQQFHSFITEDVRSLSANLEEDNERSLRNWIHIEANVLKFDYLLTVSIPENPTFEAIEAFIGSALRLLKICIQLEAECTYDVGALAIMGILSRGADAVDARFSIQAATLALHLTSTPIGKQARTLILLSIRLHMSLGLATIAFGQYPDVRVKEFLNDTVSYILLSRISHIHPFDTKGPKKMFPDDELAKVTDTIEHMESRTGDFIYTDMKDFKYDQAIELLEFKHKLRSSLTKHLCMLERRRIARLRLEPVDESMLPPKDAFNKISDNRDLDVLPNFEASYRSKVDMLWGNETRLGCPTIGWYHNQWIRDEVARCINNERSAPFNVDMFPKEEYMNGTMYPDFTMPELQLDAVWMCAMDISGYIHQIPGTWDPEDGLQSLHAKLENIHESVLRIQGSEYGSTSNEDAKLGLSEYSFTWAYGHLEILQVLTKACNRLDEQWKKKDSISRVKSRAKSLKSIREKMDGIYNSIRAVVQGRIDLLKSRGKQCIIAQVRSGATGEALKQLISDADLAHYANEYVTSALDANEGILKVKLKK